MGRLYLPRELLDEAGISSSDPVAVVVDPRVDDHGDRIARADPGLIEQFAWQVEAAHAGVLVEVA